MEHLPVVVLALLVELLPARDVARLTCTCAALAAQQPAMQSAIGLVIQRRDGVVLPFLHEEDAHWPRSPLVLRCAEVLRMKAALQSVAGASEDGVAADSKAVVVSRAWVLAWKRRCLAYEQYVAQFRPSKKKAMQHKRGQIVGARSARGPAAGATVGIGRFADLEASATKAASALIVCSHDRLRPAQCCMGRTRRAWLPPSAARILQMYASDMRGFASTTSTDCSACIEEQEEAERLAAKKRQDRFETQIAGRQELVDLLIRKKGYPSELLSPSSAAAGTHVSLAGMTPRAYYLVPRKWMLGWRKYVRSVADDAPGPILTSDLVCVAHQRTIVPPYITMFLSGFSLEVSLQATQGLGASVSTQYEIVTLREWDLLVDRYCAEYAVGFDVENGTFRWKTPECNRCHFGMGATQRRDRRNPSSAHRF